MELAQTFDTVAARYDAERAGYPAPLFDDLAAIANLQSGADILEVGCGSGQATQGFVDRGFAVTAIDPGPALINLARRRFTGAAGVTFQVSSFEAWPLEPNRFDLVASAQAWHWIDQKVGLAKAADALAPEGHLAIFGHTPQWSADLSARLEPVYQSAAPMLWGPPPEAWYSPSGPVARLIDDSGRFGPVRRLGYGWRRRYEPQAFLAYLQTRSDHNILPADQQQTLLAGIAAALDTPVDVQWSTALYVAQRAR